MVVVSIDPSINFCGFAVHIDSKLISQALFIPNKSDKEYYEKARTIFTLIKNIYDEIEGDKVLVLECPEYWKVAGHAARESGSVFKLTFLCGMIYTIDPNTIIVTPSGWKGQMSKDVVNNRLRSVYPSIDIENMNHNIVDAIGIGHWYIHKKV